MRRATTAVLALIAAVCLRPAPAKGLEVFVTVDSSAIAASTGYLDFQFSAALDTAQTATAVISDFDSTNLTLGGITYLNSASGGPLPANVTILNDPNNITNRARQAVTFAANSDFSFKITFSGNALTMPGTADSTFFVNVLDSSFGPAFPNSTPHLRITIPASGSGVPVITSIAQITAVVVPEPGTIVLAMASVAVLAIRLRARVNRSRSSY